MNCVVVGIGNILQSDDGVGVRVVEALSLHYQMPESVTVIDAGTAVLDILDQLVGLDLLVVVDAVKGGRPPGSLWCLETKGALEIFRRKSSLHQLGLLEVLSSLELMQQSPGRIVLLGVEPDCIDMAMNLSPLVAEKVPFLVEQVVALLAAAGVGLEASL